MSEYRLLGELGRGGMGVVYEAERVLDGGIILRAACKAISPEQATRADVVERFRREAAVCIRLSGDHANLVTVYDLYRDEQDRLLLAMELVDGAPLSALLRGAPLPHAMVRRLVHDILQGLAHVHAADVVHRDISPENVLVSRQGQVKLSDFGLSKVLSDTSHRSQPTFKGKAAYASPEAIHGEALDPRTDLWSLAALVHELLAGTPPFGRGDILHVLSVQAESGPAVLPADVPDDLRALTADLACMVSDARRFQSAAEMLEMLAAFAGPMSMSTRAALGAFVAERCRERVSAQGASTDPQAGEPREGRCRARTTDPGHAPPDVSRHAPARPPRPARPGRARGWMRLALLGAALLAMMLAFVVAPGGVDDPGRAAMPAPDAAPEQRTALRPLPAEPAAPAPDAGLENEPERTQPPRMQRKRPAAARARAPQVRHDERLPSQMNQEVHVVQPSPIKD